MHFTKQNLESFLLSVFFFLFVLFYMTKASWGAPLSLEDCLTMAATNHPSLTESDGKLMTGRANLKKAGANDRVQASGTASTRRSGSDGIEDRAAYSIGASATLKVFDANRSKYSIESERNSLKSTEEDAKDTLLQVQSNVKEAYMTLLLRNAIRNQQEESVKAFKQHLERARIYYEVGTKPKYDVTKAEVDLGNAQLALVEAEGNIVTARANLLNSMGIAENQELEIEPLEWEIPTNVEKGAEELALKHRADYRSANYQTIASKATVSEQARGNSPTISVSTGYNADGSEIYDLDSGWNVGMSMSVPILDGGATKASVEAARGQLKTSEASKEKLRQSILLDVRKAATSLQTERERIRITELTVVQAQESYELAQGRYETGVGDALEVTDALVSLNDAHLQAYQAKYNLQVALINLERATGYQGFIANSGSSPDSVK